MKRLCLLLMLLLSVMLIACAPAEEPPSAAIRFPVTRCRRRKHPKCPIPSPRAFLCVPT